MPTKQIIILETNPSDGGFITLRTAYWFDVTLGQEVVLPKAAVSAFKGATAEENDALTAGTVVEEVRTFIFPLTLTSDDWKKMLQIGYADRKAWRDGQPFQGKSYGTIFDGVSWTDK